jgi:hypothetical protein
VQILLVEGPRERVEGENWGRGFVGLVRVKRRCWFGGVLDIAEDAGGLTAMAHARRTNPISMKSLVECKNLSWFKLRRLLASFRDLTTGKRTEIWTTCCAVCGRSDRPAADPRDAGVSPSATAEDATLAGRGSPETGSDGLVG